MKERVLYSSNRTELTLWIVILSVLACLGFQPHLQAAAGGECVEDGYDLPCFSKCCPPGANPPGGAAIGFGGLGGCRGCGSAGASAPFDRHGGSHPDRKGGATGRPGGRPYDPTDRGMGAPAYRGMPAWRVTEPYINLVIDDEPLGYQPSRGPRLSVQLAYKQRGTNTYNPSVFGAGPGWNFSWLSYITPLVHIGGPTNYLVHFPGGGWREFELDETEYLTRANLEGEEGSGGYDAFILHEPDGSTRTYTHMVTNVAGQFLSAFMTRWEDPQGNGLDLHYAALDTNTLVVRLSHVVDPDDRTNYVYYVTNNTYSTNLIGHIVDGFGRTNYFRYADSDGTLTNLIDVIGIETSFQYDENQWITNMITPYGTNSFRLTDGFEFQEGIPTGNGRSVLATTPDGGKYFYLYSDQATGVPTSYEDIPNTTNSTYFSYSNTVDNTDMNFRNTFYWGPRQFNGLSQSFTNSLDPDDLTANDVRRARLRHWLKVDDAVHISPTLSMERAPSPDGSSEGQKVWYDYEGKNVAYATGSQRWPLFEARVLPDETTQFTRSERNDLGYPTNVISTYTRPADGEIDDRTTQYVYETNQLDLLMVLDAEGRTNAIFTYNGDHQVLSMTNSVGDVSTFTYDATTHLPILTELASGLVISNYYNSDNRLEQSVQIISPSQSATNRYTYANGLVQTHTDARDMTRTFTYDALERLTRVDYPDGTSMSNVYENLDLIGRKDRLDHWTHYTYDDMSRLTTVSNSLVQVTSFDYCDCGSLTNVTDPMQKETQFFYDDAGRLIRTEYPDGSMVTNNYNLLGQLTQVSSSTGVSVDYYYNHQGLLIQASNVIGTLYSAVYSIHDRATNRVGLQGIAESFAYDTEGRLRSRTTS